MTPDKVEIHIDELVLHGFAPAERYRIGQSLEAELTRLFGEQGVPTALTAPNSAAYFDGGSFQVTSRVQPEAIGIQVAQTIYSKLQ